MERTHRERMAYLFDRNGTDGAQRLVGIGELWLARNRFNKVARNVARRRRRATFRSAAVEQIPLGADGNSIVQIRALEPKRTAGAVIAGDDIVRCDGGKAGQGTVTPAALAFGRA